jgi:hypothetical protein
MRVADAPIVGAEREFAGEARAIRRDAVIGALSADEFAAAVRAMWRARLGHEAYAREPALGLIRAVLLSALGPGDPAHSEAAERRLSEAIGIMEKQGDDHAQVCRNLQTLSAAFRDVLNYADPSLALAIALMDAVDRRIHVARSNRTFLAVRGVSA